MTGKTLGHYKVGEQLGRGGMGEVYMAEDLNLNRKVALKFLPEAFAADPERMARFEREAKLLASLNHPNIAAIYGLEQAEGKRFLVLELVEGETLAQRISKGPLPVDEALGICRQIAEGLEAAHEKGVIHRDLKPANVMITEGDKIKILDFGLAKALSDETQSVDSSQSPTLTEAMTRPGIILGTAAYMSPEQAKGKAVDKRADIWAFGCILYECLTGKRVFEGETVTETLAAILRGEPDWPALPANTPPGIRFVLSRCLEKDLSRRFHDAADVRIEIDAAKASLLAPPAGPAIGHITWRRALLFAAGTLVLGAAITALAFWSLRTPSRQKPAHLSITLPTGDSIAGVNFPLAFSPDGNRLVYVASRSGGVPQLYVRALDNPEAKLVPGTDRASAPFFSPDGQWVAFFAQGKLKKVSIAGGAAVTICTSGDNAGASWGAADTIIFAPTASSGLFRVPAAGGNPEALTTLDASKGEISHRYPQVLPGGKALTFTMLTGVGWDDQHVVLQMLETGERRTLVRGGHTGRILPTGHLVYCRAGTLFALLFDLARQKVMSSAPVTIAEGIRQSNYIAGEYSFSNNGSLAYIPAGPRPFDWRLAWMDRNGKSDFLAAPPKYYDEIPALSPDGRQVASGIEADTTDLWIYDLERGNFAKLTSEGSSQFPVWTPDGKRIAYMATRGGFRNIFWRAADGTGTEERLTVGKNLQIPSSWSPDGKTLAFFENSPATGFDIWLLEMEGTHPNAAASRDNPKLRPFLRTPFRERNPMFSPDGHWLAYASDKTGRFEVYVQPFPGPGREWPVSTDGGVYPIWAPSGRELFYATAKEMMAVDIETAPTFRMGKPRLLFETEENVVCMAPDGRRFLAVIPVERAQDPTQIRVILNWLEELKQRVPK
jgi:serine/threonine protein kinase/Tol biopolymer transport system component